MEVSNEKTYIDSLAKEVNGLFENLDLSWDDILRSLTHLEKNAQTRFGRTSRSVAFILHKQGVACYNKGLEGYQEAFNTAVRNYQKAIAIRTALNNDHILTPDIIRGYNNIAGCYFNLHDPYQSIANLTKALSISFSYPERTEIEELMLELNTQAARANRMIGDYDNTLNYYSTIIQWPEDEKQKKVTLWKIRALLETAGIQANYLDRPAEALVNLRKAEKKLTAETYPGGEVLLANLYYNKSIAYEMLEKFDSALIFIKKSITLNKKNKQNMLADNYVNIAVLLKKKNQPDSSLFYLKKAESIFMASGQKSELSFVYDNHGDLEFLKGNFSQSLRLYNQALECLVSDFKPRSVYNNPVLTGKAIFDKQRLLVSLESKAFTFLQLYRQHQDIDYLSGAYRTFQLADYLVGRIRSEYSSNISKLWLAGRTKRIYSRAIDTCWELYKLSGADSCLYRAFEYSEKSRAILLLDAMLKTNPRFDAMVPFLEEAKALGLKINFFEKSIALAQEHDTHEQLDSLLLYRRRYQEVINRFQKDHPAYYQFTYNQNVVNPGEIKNNLLHDQSLIEYFLSDKSLYIFTITSDTMVLLKKEISGDLHALINDFNIHILSLDQKFTSSAFKLFQHLIQPVKDQIPVKSDLILVPDDILSTISFDALVTKNPGTQRIYFPSYTNYLIFEHQICYAFSASTLFARKKSQQPRREYIGFAPAFEKAFFVKETFFDKLTWNMTEVEQVQSLFQGDYFTREKASLRAFINHASEYKLIHLATHARANNISGDLSFIAFGYDSTDVVYTKDLYALDLHADMVVLSACQTGAGSLHQGEGVISLARGFMYSGARSVITSLWSVKEEPNKNIILYFYEGIKNGLPKDQALRDAKLKYLKSITRENQENAHPFYWAHLICIGDLSPYQATNSINLWVIFLASIFLAAFFVFLRKYRKM